MRVIGELPHEIMKITLFHWNNRYLVKFELGQFEQTYKIGEMDVAGLEGVRTMVDEEFKNDVLKQFVEMRSSFHTCFTRLNNKK